MNEKINKNAEVAITNNTLGGIHLSLPNGTPITLSEYKDTAFIEYSELAKLINRNRKIFSNLSVVITETIDNDLEEIIKDLRLEKEYALFLNAIQGDYDLGFIDVSGLDNRILNSTETEFKKLMNKNNPLRKVVAEHSMMLYRENKLKDLSKLNIITDSLNVKSSNTFWQEAKESVVEIEETKEELEDLYL